MRSWKRVGNAARTDTPDAPGATRPASATGLDRWDPDASFYLLVFEEDSSFVHRLPPGTEAVIGRVANADLRVHDPTVAARHARIVTTTGHAHIEDLGSPGGTWVNGERIEGARPLASADTIALGNVTLVFHSRVRSSTASRAALPLAAFRQRMEEELERLRRYQRPLTLVALSVGDADHGRASEALLPRLRMLDVVAWAGADLLLVLMPETGPEGAAAATRRAVEAVARSAPEARGGHATAPLDGCDVDTLVASARAAVAAARPGAIHAASDTFRTLQLGERAVIVADPAMLRLYGVIERLATSDLTVLVCGETGAGKELAATALHVWSTRRDRPYVTLNCAAIHESLVESELFGHEKGAFTGATAAKPGLLETGHGGTVFMDEIGELSATVQAKLLRALETKRFTRLGDVQPREIDVRIVAATNRDLEEEVAAGRFRQDLFFRLAGATLWLPPLRDRKRELPMLAQAFLSEACARTGRAPMTLTPAAMQRLAAHAWPGNVRELKNVMEFIAATIAEPALEAWHLVERLGGSRQRRPSDPEQLAPTAPRTEPTFRPIEEEVQELERRRMAEALVAGGGNQTRAADLIGMPRRTFVTKMRQYNIPRRGA